MDVYENGSSQQVGEPVPALPTLGASELVPMPETQLAAAAASRNPVAVFLARLSPGSRRSMAQALETAAEMLSSGRGTAAVLPWHQLRYQHVAALRSALAEHYRPASANKILAAVRGVLREAWRLGLLDAESLARAIDVGPVRGQTLPPGRRLTSQEKARLFAACAADNSATGLRDAAALAVGLGAGLRRAEIVGLDVADWNPSGRELRVRSGKGNKDRLVPLANLAASALDDWIRVRGAESGPLFLATGRGGKIAPRRISAQTLFDALAKRCQQAGIAAVSPHDLRRTFISDVLDATGDLSRAQRLAGHASPSTTSRYDRRGDEALRQASAAIAVPYLRPAFVNAEGRAPQRPGSPGDER